MMTDTTTDRATLETYATWLYFERQRLVQELYPGVAHAHEFVRADNDGLGWHYDAPAPSTRAEAVLQLVGVSGNKPRA